jgi:SAM-dependent methyltransferase
MPGRPIDALAARYDAWFEAHPAAYASELNLLRRLLPAEGVGLDVGVGPGRFAAALGLDFGVDLAPGMLALAAGRGVRVARGRAESLPFRGGAFARVLSVTTLCFVENPAAMLAEIHRVLKPGGTLVLGMLDCGGPAGMRYFEAQSGGAFFRHARRETADEVDGLLRRAGFTGPEWWQTVSTMPEAMRAEEAAAPGHGTGIFAACRAVRHGTG